MSAEYPREVFGHPGLYVMDASVNRWRGKRFREVDSSVSGVNLLRTESGGELRETLPLSVGVIASLIDTTPTSAVTYAAGTDPGFLFRLGCC